MNEYDGLGFKYSFTPVFELHEPSLHCAQFIINIHKTVAWLAKRSIWKHWDGTNSKYLDNKNWPTTYI
jgi:hypothetical protein